MPARPLLILAGLLATGAVATPTIDPQFGNHAVIQRAKPIVISGTASPNSLAFNDERLELAHRRPNFLANSVRKAGNQQPATQFLNF